MYCSCLFHWRWQIVVWLFLIRTSHSGKSSFDHHLWSVFLLSTIIFHLHGILVAILNLQGSFWSRIVLHVHLFIINFSDFCRLCISTSSCLLLVKYMLCIQTSSCVLLIVYTLYLIKILFITISKTGCNLFCSFHYLS